MQTISFKYRAEIQARWLTFMQRKTGRDILELAMAYGEKLAEKIASKYKVAK